MTYDIQAAIAWSLSFVGYVEESDGDTPWSRRWGYPGGAWCGMFFESAEEAAGGSIDNDTGTSPFTHYTPDGAMRFAERGDWHTEPEEGDAVYFTWAGPGLSANPDFGAINHIGRVVNKDNWPEFVETVEGNISNSVVNTIRYNNGQIVGFGRPRGSVTKPEPTPAPQPPEELPITEEDEALNIYVGGNGKGAWFMQAGGHLIPVSKGDVTLKQRPAVNVIYCTDAFIQRLAKTLPVAR